MGHAPARAPEIAGRSSAAGARLTHAAPPAALSAPPGRRAQPAAPDSMGTVHRPTLLRLRIRGSYPVRRTRRRTPSRGAAPPRAENQVMLLPEPGVSRANAVPDPRGSLRDDSGQRSSFPARPVLRLAFWSLALSSSGNEIHRHRFETANADRGSACAVGLVMVENGEVVGRVRQLIRPEPCWFDPMNVSIHGITPADVAARPRSGSAGPSSGRTSPAARRAQCILRHERHPICPGSLRTAVPETDLLLHQGHRETGLARHPTYALDYIARVLGITFRHHDAEEDARACAHVAVAACRQLHVRRCTN